MTRLRRAGGAAAALALFAITACSGDTPLDTRDATPPSVTILQPANQAVVTTRRPSFVARVSDSGSGIFTSTINADLDGTNVSQSFINGYDPARGEIQVSGVLELADGLHTLVLRVTDNAGNRTETRVSFTVLVSAPGGGT